MDLNRLPEENSPVPDYDVICSICLDPASRNDERSIVELKCKHKFHLDCIGSAFNAKMSMECPNCRNVEVGNWMIPSGYVPDDHWNNEETMHFNMFEPNHLRELAISIHWCPFDDVAPSSTYFNEPDFASSSYTHANVHRWRGPSGHVYEDIGAQHFGWENNGLILTAGIINNIVEPIPSSSLASLHPFLSPLSVGLYDQGMQPDHPTQNLIDLLRPRSDAGSHVSSINLRPFFPTSTERGHQTRPNQE